jgi:hypothetical protein
MKKNSTKQKMGLKNLNIYILHLFVKIFVILFMTEIDLRKIKYICFTLVFLHMKYPFLVKGVSSGWV